VIDANPEAAFVMSDPAPAARVCVPSTPCWKSNASGFTYTTSGGGIQKAKLHVSRAGVAAISLSGPGSGKFQIGHWTAPQFPLTLPLTVRVNRSDGPQCWEATFSTLRSNKITGVLGKSD